MDVGKMSFGEFIEHLRKEKGLSMRQVAELAKISHTEVKRIEDGVRKQPSPQVLRLLAKALDTPYEELMEQAGYIDETPEKKEESTAVAGITGVEDLSEDELAQVNQYIAFIKSQRK
ncbi:MAG: helix-turn-helix domain-containing protein [Bacillota bacterium]|jgi:transcriptional regulator with XRE-family HTH domain